MHQSIFHQCGSRLKGTGILGFTAAIFACGMVETSSAQNSPVGVWDLTMSRGRAGTAIVEFNSDFTLSGSEITSARSRKSSHNDEDRNGGTREDDNNSNSGSNGTNVVENAYGGAVVGGWWSYDERGRLIGFYESITVYVGDAMPTTNAVSFRGIVRPGRSITLMASSEEGRTIFRGRPNTPNDVAGNYIVSLRADGGETIEFLSMTPSAYPNEFNITGCGPGYSYDGFALITGGGQMSIQTLSFDSQHFVAVTGRFSSSRQRGTLRGQNLDNQNITFRLVPNLYGTGCAPAAP